MILTEIIQNLREIHPHAPEILAVATAGLSGVLAYYINRICRPPKSPEGKGDFTNDSLVDSSRLTNNSGSLHSSNDVLELESTKEDNDNWGDYTPRTARESIKYDKESEVQSTIEGVVENWRQSLRGYSGFIKDNSGRVPFYFDEDKINESEGEGLVPLIFDHSIKNNIPIKMNVTLSENHPILCVERMLAEMDGREYEI